MTVTRTCVHDVARTCVHDCGPYIWQGQTHEGLQQTCPLVSTPQKRSWSCKLSVPVRHVQTQATALTISSAHVMQSYVEQYLSNPLYQARQVSLSHAGRTGKAHLFSVAAAQAKVRGRTMQTGCLCTQGSVLRPPLPSRTSPTVAQGAKCRSPVSQAHPLDAATLWICTYTLPTGCVETGMHCSSWQTPHIQYTASSMQTPALHIWATSDFAGSGFCWR